MLRLTKLLPALVVLFFVQSLPCDADGPSVPFRRGDVNRDGRSDLSDPIFTLHALFLGGEPFSCEDSADTNDDGAIDISDALYTLLHLFVGGPPEPAPRQECGTDPTPDHLGCATYEPCDILLGQSEFSSPLAGAPGDRMRGAEDDTAGPPGDGSPPDPSPAAAGEPRLIEESDIYKLVGQNLFVLNRYRGLQVLDIENLDKPTLVGWAPIFGYPRDMYVRGNTAYVIVSDYYDFWRDGSSDTVPPQGFYGSQLRIIDVSDVRNPVVVGGINLAGECSDSRIVGDVMYLVSQRYPWYYGFGTADTEDMTEVLSVEVGDPAQVKVIDSKNFPRNGWEHHIYVTESAVYLASSGFVGREFSEYETSIRYIDISDPAGGIVVRGEIAVPGGVRDRWSMDEYENVLRVASGQAWGNGDVYLTTISVSNPDSLQKLGSYTLTVDENLTAARFDGPRGYLVSYRNIDPLFTFDLSNPAKPALLGQLDMTGWLDFIVPLGGGERLVALGHEDLTNPDGSRTISLAVSLIDVSTRERPKLLSRVALDGVWGWVPGNRDDFAKVFRTIPEQGLILFPFQAWSATDYRYIGGVQLIDFDSTKLTRRGLIENAGWVERGIPYAENTVMTLSSEVFQIVDIADRDEPRVRARLELARNVQEFALLPGDFTVQLAGDWYAGDTELVVTPIADPNALEPVSRTHVPAPYGRIFVNGSLVYVTSVQQTGTAADGTPSYATVVQVVDLADPASPRLRGSVTLPEEVWVGYRYWYWGSGDEVVQVNGSTLAFHRYFYPYILWDCRGCPSPAVDAAGGGKAAGEVTENSHKIYLVDLSNADEPKLASTVTLDAVDWAWGLKASGTTLFLSFYQAFLDKEQWMAHYYLGRIDVSDPSNPVTLPDVNIPGMFIDASQGSFIYTLESWWDATAQKSRNLFHVLAIADDTAYLQSSVELEGYPNGILVKEGAAFATVQWWESVTAPGGIVDPVVGDVWQSAGHVDLVAIDLGDPKAIKIAGKAEIPYDYGYLQEVEGGRAFIGSGAGIFTYLIEDLSSPTFEKFFRTQGWTQDIVVRGDHAFVPSGYYGVQVLDLASPPGA